MYVIFNIIFILTFPENSRNPSTQVFDFGQAQRAAHEAEFVELCVSMKRGFDLWEPETQANERSRLRTEAQKHQSGCDVHWKRSVLQVQNKSSLIPAQYKPAFSRLTRSFIDPNTTSTEFPIVEAEFRRLFPSAEGWLEWWLRPAIAQMIFPAFYSGDASIRSQVPKTSNAVEARHSLLHRSSGSDHDILSGIEGIVLHVEELESRYNAIRSTSSSTCLSLSLTRNSMSHGH